MTDDRGQRTDDRGQRMMFAGATKIGDVRSGYSKIRRDEWKMAEAVKS